MTGGDLVAVARVGSTHRTLKSNQIEEVITAGAHKRLYPMLLSGGPLL